MLKLATFFVVLAVAHAGILRAGAPVAVAQPVFAKQNIADEFDPHPQYNFGYEIQDALSGDSKNQVEARDGDVVQGQYSLIDADGFKRIVDYSADSLNGFNAVVRREPLAVKAVATAPAIVKSAPIAFAASPVATFVKSPAPALIKSTAVHYATAPAALRAPTLNKSAPLVSSASIVKTSYASPHAVYAY